MTDEPPELPSRGGSLGRRLAIGAFLVVGLLLGGAAGVNAMMTRHHAAHTSLSCMNNLSQLAQVFLMRSADHPDEPVPFGGSALWLSYRKDHSDIKRGYERVLLCPNDDDAKYPETEDDKRAWDDVDLAHPSPHLCSYAARDFERCPLPAKSPAREAVGACLHHEGFAIVAFSEGDVQKMTLEELGLASDDEMVVGPESKSPLLRLLKY